ncbi:hypothetical protein WMY93_009843 [Mugilogobius chulae]|uniref:Polycystic kidney disease 1 n=1 Tax=Mugilogobius chulae TaxID=88201 RepID=A0AAW0PEJ2_9GOBI
MLLRRRPFIKNKQVLLSPDNFLTGLVFMSGVYAQTQVQVLPRPADVGPKTVEMQLFPGLWFSHAGQLSSVDLVVQPSAELTQARLQILRPYCSPDHHLVPPGCLSLLNPFSACSAMPLCNTTGGCGLALHWCPLLETCVPSTQPCSPYDPAARTRGFTLPPRHPSGGAPLYHLASDLAFTVQPTSEPTTVSLLLPSKPITVYPDDVVAVQHTRSPGSFLRCRSPVSSADSPWLQSYLSISRPDWGGWLEGGLTFAAKVDSGTSVTFTWMLDDLISSAHEGVSYNVRLKNVAQYQLKVTASNPVSSQTQSFLLSAEEFIPFSDLEFLSLGEIVAVGSSQLFAVKVKADISFSLIFRWDFSDSSNSIIHSHSALCEKMDGLVDKEVKVMDTLDTLNYTFNKPNDYTVTVQVFNQFSKLEVSKKISVREKLQKILVFTSPLVPIVNQIFLLEAAAEPKSNNILYTWDFEDSSSTVLDNIITHTFGTPGLHNITVTANNNISVVTSWILVEVMEKITGLDIGYNGPTEIDTVTYFKADVQTGTNLTWQFDFGDGSYQDNLRDGSTSHIYKSPGNFTVGVTVSNSVSEIHQTIIVEVYKLEVHGILPTGCVTAGQKIHLTALVNGNISILTFYWLFGDGMPLRSVRGNASTSHLFKKGTFNLNLTVASSVARVSFSASLCVEVVIANVDLSPRKYLLAVGEEVCFEVLVDPDIQDSLKFEWSVSVVKSMTKSNKKCFVFNEEGIEEVAVLVSNSVSNKMTKTFVTVQKPVGKCLVEHGQKSALIVNSVIHLWVTNCDGSNVTVQWDFGDDSLIETGKNVTHIFASTGQFIVTATARNLVSKESTSIQVSIISLVSDLSIYTKQIYVTTGKETIFTAVSSTVSNTNYYWTVVGVTSTVEGTDEFSFTFAKPGMYRVEVVVHNLIDTKESAITIHVLDRIEGIEIVSASLTDLKYIPTHQEVLFKASVSKGSSVAYHWRAMQDGEVIQTTTKAEVLRFVVEKPGEIVITLRVENKLGAATSNITVVALENVKIAKIDELQQIVPLGELSNISVAVVRGSDLHYSWFINSNQYPILTQVPFLLYRFTKLGTVSIVITVQNILSQSNVSKIFVVQEEIQEVGFTIEGKMAPFYVKTNISVAFSGHVKKGSNLHWYWIIEDGTSTYFNTSSKHFVRNFQKYGIYSVSLNVSNGLSWKMIADNLTVQDGIEGLALNATSVSVCVNERVDFKPVIRQGTNVSYVITFGSNGVNQSYDFAEEFSTSSLAIGTHLVTIKAWNQVSVVEVSSVVTVNERVQGLQLVNCCSATLEALKGLVFTASVENKYSINYTWIFEMEGFELTRLFGQDVVFTPQNIGILRLTVVASNGACSNKVTKDAKVELPVKSIDLTCDFENVFIDYATSFTAKANGSNLIYEWDFGDTSKLMLTKSNKVIHTYHKVGKYVVTVTLFNNVSNISQKLFVEAREIECSKPQVLIVQSQRTIFKSRPSYFEANVQNSCSLYKTTYLWEIFSCNNLNITGKRVNFQTKVHATSPFLQLPKHSLDVGQYCLVFTAFLKGTPMYGQQNISVTVVHSPLMAVIKGGSDRTWPSNRDLVLDGSQSRNPDVEPGLENELEFDWTVHTKISTDGHFEVFGGNSSKTTISKTHLRPGTIYVITLTVHKPGRKPSSANQTVMVTETAVPVTVACASCSAPYISSMVRPLKLHGLCEVCSDQAQYKWTCVDQNGRNLNIHEMSSGSSSPYLVVRSGALDPSDTFTFTLSVFEPQKSQRGRASLTLQSHPTPQGGQCELSPHTGVLALDTELAFNCSEWKPGDTDDEAAQLIYSFQVASCVLSDNSSCPVLTLYRGIRSTFSSVVPRGSQNQETGTSLITILVLIEDNLGAKTTALNSQAELWPLVQHGNPHEIIPFSMALLSHLNQVEPQNTQDVQARTEMRQNLTQALASLSISSLNDAAQVSSALMQSTDLLCTGQPNMSTPCPFEIPTSLARHLGAQNSELVQVVWGIGEALESNPLLTSADPPITTDVVAMEISTPEGKPVSVQDLEAERAIRVTLPRKSLVEEETEACLVMSLSEEENQRNFTVKDLKGLDVNAGLYVSFNFSLVPGLTAQTSLSPSPSRLRSSAAVPSECRSASSPLCAAFITRPGADGAARVCGRWRAPRSAKPLPHRHLTMFGASLFVHPGAVVLLPPPVGPVRTLLASIVCALVALLHLLLGLVSHRLDHWDRRRLNQVPLCGRPGLYHYRVLVKTGRRPGAGTTAHVGISLFGVTTSGSVHLQREGSFQRGGLDHFHLETELSLGEVWKIRLWHDNTGLDPSWYVQHVVVWDPQTDSMFFFLVNDWLSVENPKHGSVEKEVLASCKIQPDELSGFRRVLSSQLLFGLVDRHLWWSVWERPAHSHFTRAQRVSCCALSLHLYLALGVLWYGAVGSMEHSGPVSAHVLVNVESVAVGMILALLVFPLQCLLCFLFGKTFSPVSVELSVPPSPLCHSVEMDVCLDQSRLSGPSFMSLPGSCQPIRDSPSSFLDLDSSLLDLWASSGLVPHSPFEDEEELWPSCTSLLPVPAQSPALGPARLLRRKKALMQRRQCTSKAPRCPPTIRTQGNQAGNCLTTLFTLSGSTHLFPSFYTNSISTSPRSTCSGSWSEDSEVRYLSEEDDPGSRAPLWHGGLYRSASEASIDSVASTVLPSPPPDCTRCPSTTRIGVPRGPPAWLLPSWSLRVLCPLVAVLIVTCMVLVGLYGSFFSRPVLLMWLTSVFVAFLTSALLLELAKVFFQAVLLSSLWRPVDPEVEEVLAHDTSVVRPFSEHSEHIRPPCGYGLIQAKQEAHKVRALTSLMRHCVWQLLFLMLLLMVNYQDHVEQQKARLLHSASRQHLHTAPTGVPNLTALRHWPDAEQWVRVVLVLTSTNAFSAPGRVTVVTRISELNMNHGATETLCQVTQSLSITLCSCPRPQAPPDLQTALSVVLVMSGLLMLTAELYSVWTERVQFVCRWTRWFHFLLASLSVATGILQLNFLSVARSCLSELQQQPNGFIGFHRAALISQRSSECAAVLLTLLVLRVILVFAGTLRFVRRWVVMGRVLRRAWKELVAIALLLMLMLLLCTHLANTLFAATVEGFMPLQQASVSVLSLLRGHKAVHSLCRAHPHLGTLYCLLLTGGTLWLLVRVCAAVLIRAYRSEKTEMFCPTIEPQDYEMVEFFIKRLKLWMGLTKAKEASILLHLAS